VEIEATFAYDSFRPGQKELASQIYQHCLTGGVSLAEAMSGFGKTAAVLCGAVAAAEETGTKVVYACRTKRQIHRVVEELSRLQKRHPISAISLSSKFDYCLLRRAASRSIPQESFGWYCGFNVSNNLCSYFLNVPLLGRELDTIVDNFAHNIPSHPELLSKSESIHVCPYELARLVAAQAKIIVAPYQYVFDPDSKPILFERNNLEPARTILVVDEAHNIRDFLRGLRSGTLTLDEMAGAIREADSMMMVEVASALRLLKDAFESLMKETTSWHLDRPSFVRRLAARHGAVWTQNLVFALNSCSEAAWASIAYERRLPSSMLKVGEFLLRLISSESSVLAKWENTLGLIDPDPANGFSALLAKFRSSVLLSATINPSPVFLRSLALDSLQPRVYRTQTRFPVVVRTVIDTGVTTRYRSRSPQMYSRIAEKVAAVAGALKHGVGVFAPSYSVLGPLTEMIKKRLPYKNIVSESRGMSSDAAAEAFDSFASKMDSVLLGVQGGRFSEGEDFRGDLMDATVVVGLALPPPSPMLYAEYACLKRAGEPDSYLMLSRLPALRKAFQAAGRHIRDPGKRGLVFLLDDRFDTPTVMELMPSWLGEDVVRGDFTPQEIQGIVDDFWNPEAKP